MSVDYTEKSFMKMIAVVDFMKKFSAIYGLNYGKKFYEIGRRCWFHKTFLAFFTLLAVYPESKPKAFCQ